MLFITLNVTNGIQHCISTSQQTSGLCVAYAIKLKPLQSLHEPDAKKFGSTLARIEAAAITVDMESPRTTV